MKTPAHSSDTVNADPGGVKEQGLKGSVTEPYDVPQAPSAPPGQCGVRARAIRHERALRNETGTRSDPRATAPPSRDGYLRLAARSTEACGGLLYILLKCTSREKNGSLRETSGGQGAIRPAGNRA